MDYPVISPRCGSAAVVVWANYYQFGPGEVVTNRQVESRAFVWSDSGCGSVDVGESIVELTRSTFVFLPWRHDITYRASRHDPFMATAIHVIPWHALDVPVETYAAHGRRDHLAGVEYRRDEDWPDLSGVVVGSAPRDGRLLSLARLVVDHVQHGRPDAASLRALAAVLLNELRTSVQTSVAPQLEVPPRLARMQHYIRSHLHRPLTVAQVAASIGVSPSSAERLFRQYGGTSVVTWMVRTRMQVAREQLRASNATVAEVGRSVGIGDPAYFSRLFRRHHGVSPRAYARQARSI